VVSITHPNPTPSELTQRADERATAWRKRSNVAILPSSRAAGEPARRAVLVILTTATITAAVLLALQSLAAFRGSDGVMGLKVSSAATLLTVCAAAWARVLGVGSLAKAFAGVAGAIAAATMIEHLTGVELHIGRADDPSPLGRMGGNSATMYLLLSASIALDLSPTRRIRVASDGLVMSGAAIALLALVAHLFGSQAQYPFASFDPMALSTAIVGIAVSVALVLDRGDRGLGQLLGSNATGGVMARRIIPVLLVAPMLIARLALVGVEAGTFDAGFAAALSVLASVVILVAVLVRSAQVVDRLDTIQRGNEAQIRQMIQDLTRTNRELESFSYSVSHDLRAPIRHIAGFTQLLEAHAREGLDPKSKKYLATIAESAENAGKLIDELLEFSRIGRAALQSRDLDLRELFDERWRQLAMERGGRTIELVVGKLPPVHADPTFTGVVITNLLSNAMKYTEPRDAAVVEVTGRRDGRDVIVDVRDNGVGFDMKYVDKLFGVFQRLHGEEFAGVGIGLANVKRIVERHGGRVWAEGRPDGGATFHFSLPAAKEANP
jgi:signal transduction histidine kinase